MTLAGLVARWRAGAPGQSVIGRFAIQGIGQVGSMACSFAVTLVMVRALGVSGFGYAALGQSALTYALVVSNFGTDIFATQTTAHDHTTLNRNLTAVMAVRAVMLVPTTIAIAALCLSGVWEPDEQLAVALFSLSAVANIAYPLWAAQALERAKAIAAVTFGVQLLNLVFALAAAWLHGGVVAFALAKIGSDAIVAIALSVWMRRELGGRPERISLAFFRDFLRRSAPLGVSGILRALALASDLIMLSFYVSSTLVGLYAVPFRIFLVLLTLSGVYSVVILPTYVRGAAQGSEALASILKQTMRLPFLAYLAGLIAIGLTARLMLGLIFGPDFAAGSLSLQILMIAAACNFSNRSYRLVMLASHRQVDDMRSTIVATLINLVAKAVLIPLFGIAGVAAGTAIGEASLALLQRRNASRAIASLGGG